MQGTLHIIPPGSNTPHRIVKLTRAVTLDELQEAVGGFAERIPNFDSIFQDGRVQLCIAFCDEDGKQKNRSENQWANTLWMQAIVRRFGQGKAEPGDVLVGSVVLLTGDTEFLEALSKP